MGLCQFSWHDQSPAPGAPKAPRTPKLGVLRLSATSGTARESTGWLRSRLDREWHLPFTLLSDVSGSLFRVDVSGKSPLAQGVGDTAWQFYISDTVMTEQDPARVAVSYPAATSPDWFVSGYQRGGEELGGTAAVVDEPIGKGRTVVFGGEPNFRAFSDGTAKLLFNAITGPSPVAKVSPEAGTLATQAAAKLSELESPIRVTLVRTASAAPAGSRRRSGHGHHPLTLDAVVLSSVPVGRTTTGRARSGVR
jgi:hypothetical protein